MRRRSLRSGRVLAFMGGGVGLALLLACTPHDEPFDGNPNAHDSAPPPEPAEKVTVNDPCAASDFNHPSRAVFQPFNDAKDAGARDGSAEAAAPPAPDLDAGPSPYSACPIKEVDVTFERTSSPLYTKGALGAVGGDRGEVHVALPTGAVLTIADGKTVQRTPMLLQKSGESYSQTWSAGQTPGTLAIDRTGIVTMFVADANGAPGISTWKARNVSSGEEVELVDLRNVEAGDGNPAVGVGPASGDLFLFSPHANKLLRRTGATWSATATDKNLCAFALGADDRPYLADRGAVIDPAGTRTNVPHLEQAIGPYQNNDDTVLAAIGVNKSGVLHLGHVADDLQLTWFPNDHSDPSAINIGGGTPTCAEPACGGSCSEPYSFVPISGYAVMTDATDRIWVAYVWAKATRTWSSTYHSGGGGITLPGLGTIGGGSGCSDIIKVKADTAEIVVGRLEGSPPALVTVARIPTAPDGIELSFDSSYNGIIPRAGLRGSLRDGKIHLTRSHNIVGGTTTEQLQHYVVDVP